MRILAADDEALALEGLVGAIRKAAPYAEILGFRSGKQLLEEAKKQRPDAVFLDVEMRGSSGIDTAAELCRMQPDINIIFTTAYRDYMEEAFGLHASGYVLKPVTVEKVRKELEHLRHPGSNIESEPPSWPRPEGGCHIWVRTFGEFEIFYDAVPLEFTYARSKELLAILVDRKGNMCSMGQLSCLLWEEDDGRHDSYLRNLLSDVQKVLREKECSDVLLRRRGAVAIDTGKILCDYYLYLGGKEYLDCGFNGQYMSQYSWAEETLASLLKGGK